ncbi:MAG: DMT family transporter [Pseudomonadota bacterium]
MTTANVDSGMLKQPVVEANADSPVQGMALIFFGIGIFSIQDIIIRQLGGTYPGFEIMFFRGLVALGPIALLVYFSGGFKTLYVSHPWLNVLRGLLGLFSYTAYYMGLQALPLAEATAIFFVSPLVVTMLSALMLGEVVRVRRWAAILAGFAGVIMIANPTGEFASWAILLPLLAATTYALSIIITRSIGKTQTGASLAFYAMLVFVFVSGAAGLAAGDKGLDVSDHPSLIFLFRGWSMPTLWDGFLISLCGLIAAAGFYCLAQGYKVAPVSLVAPFEFVSMPLAVFWGYAIWSEIPSLQAILGIAIIVLSGVYVLKRESAPEIKPLTTGKGVRLRL